MAALFQVIAALLASHAGSLARHVKRMVAFGASLVLVVLIGLTYFVILLTHLLALLVGTTMALAIMTVLAGFVCLLFLRALRQERRRLVVAHRQYVEEERRALCAAGIETVQASKLSGGIAALSASVAAVIVLILRRLEPAEAEGERSPEGAAAEEASPEA